jgi:hypothetical protein
MGEQITRPFQLGSGLVLERRFGEKVGGDGTRNTRETYEKE